MLQSFGCGRERVWATSASRLTAGRAGAGAELASAAPVFAPVASSAKIAVETCRFGVALESFWTITFTSTAADSREIAGVVTNTPHWAICTGAVFTSQTLR